MSCRHLAETLYDETNPRLRTTTMADDHDHGDVTRLHLSTTDRIFARANPFIWNMPDWYLHRIRLFSKASASHPGLHNARIGLASKSRYRMYPYTAQNPCHELIFMTSSVTRPGSSTSSPPPTRCVSVYYCRTYFKAVRVGGGG